MNIHTWMDSLRRGHTFATNGPLLDFTLGDQTVGGELKLPSASNEVKFRASLRSVAPVDHLQIVCNGEVIRDLP